MAEARTRSVMTTERELDDGLAALNQLSQEMGERNRLLQAVQVRHTFDLVLLNLQQDTGEFLLMSALTQGRIAKNSVSHFLLIPERNTKYPQEWLFNAVCSSLSEHERNSFFMALNVKYLFINNLQSIWTAYCV